MGAAYKILGKTVQPHVLAISTGVVTAAVTYYFTMKPKSSNEAKDISHLNEKKDDKTANINGKDDDVMKSIEGFLNDLEKDAKQDTKAKGS
ncbi:hypothetical protein SMKI_15G1780 [Saccharomyces mikatae IFO 1815]|uniref:Uncharacterized protein n=1 Tax=Saccharomyces mikatae IFO 1815 TaxID=226126 RepID=A0AA35ISY6_SACMI|nr:uncharacterized protein SMKI_15G1780 [Saccharomyces mikatae IFO 1815]CAI4036338.1 hypothetical protein SMKI_15G1780 [Saccharomyces mikatae IFO 1815]